MKGVCEVTNHEGQFEITTYENGKTLRVQTIDDPFIFCRLVPKGWRAAWQVLRGKLSLEVNVRGKHNAVYRAVMTADYTPDPPREQVTTGECFDLKSA